MESNAIVFVGLCDEYCRELEAAREADRDEFVDRMLRLLPRLYISAFDIAPDIYLDQDVYIEQALDEDYYDAVRRNVETLLGPDDVYLEVFEEDMKYSDTPVAVSLAEQLADIYQEMFNFASTVREASPETLAEVLADFKWRFDSYLSATICSALRATNTIYQNEL